MQRSVVVVEIELPPDPCVWSEANESGVSCELVGTSTCPLGTPTSSPLAPKHHSLGPGIQP